MISFNIDEKSLFRGITNDYKKGQTATIATPLNQSKNPAKYRKDIYDFLNSYPSISIDSIPSTLSDKCLKKTTSKSECKLVKFIVFSKFSLDGIEFDPGASYAMYVKEEISEYIKNQRGEMVENTHLGRQRLCYPISLSHKTDGYNIDNCLVLEKIMEVNGGFAYVVNGFDVDTENGILNFRTTMVGLRGVLLSNVFKRGKGVGVKLNVNGINFDEKLYSHGKGTILSTTESNDFFQTLEKIRRASRENGKRGEEYVLNNIEKILNVSKLDNPPVHVSDKYPQSPYDIEIFIDGVKKYIEVKSTSKDKKVFIMSKGERHFMKRYDKDYVLILVTNVNSNKRRTFKYKRKDIEDANKMTQELQNIKYIVKNS